MVQSRHINYKDRLRKGLEAIIVITDLKKDEYLNKRIKKIAEAQLRHLDGVENKDSGQRKI